jgi:hypothetical protein
MVDKPTTQRSKVFELFENGKRFTEELLRENEKLRLANAQLQTESREIKAQFVQVDVPHLQHKVRLLEEELASLRQENNELRALFASVEQENREFADRYLKVERQNSDLVNLYVASYRLHSTLNFDEVLAIIKEIVINMIGSETFGIYVVDEKARGLALITHEGMEDMLAKDNRHSRVPLGEGALGKTAQNGEIYTAPEGTPLQEVGPQPIVCIPLKAGERLVGVISIHRLLLQKDGFRPVDFELFELLAGHAATALYSAKMYSLSERKRSTLEGFIDLLRQSDPEAPSKS